jgi:superfamily II DNA or RNA helicase
MSVTLRPFQASAVAEIRGAYQSGQRRVLFVLPTGGGKTYTFVYIAEQAAIRGNRVCILVHRQELVDQASRSLHAIGCQHGIIAAGYRQDLRQGVQVASVQTLARRLHTIPADFFQLLIVDVAHHAVAGTWAKVLTHHHRAHVLGVTATPERLDGRGLGDQFETLIEGPDAAWLTEHDFLVPARIFAPPGIDLGGIKRFDTRKGQHDAEAILRQGQAMGDAVSHYRRTIEPVHNGTAIAFCCSVAHADAVAEAFRAQGISAARLDGSMDRGARRRLIADLGAGVVKVLTSCDIISEGTDIPSVTGAMLLRPTDSLGLHLQQIGRVLRPSPGKPYAVINDHVGNTLRHGRPTDPRDWSLDGQPKRKRAASDALPIKVCDSCFSAIPSASPTCPECGHVFPQAARRELATVEGELQELPAGVIARQKRNDVARARTREELEVIRLERGYSRGWTDHILRARGNRHGARAFG